MKIRITTQVIILLGLLSHSIASYEVEAGVAVSDVENSKQKTHQSASQKSNNSSNKHILDKLINEQGLSGDPSKGRLLPSINSPKAQLGKKLFFTKGLGGDKDSACVSCHHPVLGGGDGLSLPIGVSAVSPDLLGPGRLHDANAVHYDGGPTVPRNSPTTFNVALWDQALFHDGRVESLGKTVGMNGADDWGIRTPDSSFNTPDVHAGHNLVAAQARFPVTSPEEMRGFVFEADNDNTAVRSALESRLTAFDGWREEFMATFGDATISYERIADALSEYERSQIFVNSPWKDFVNGNKQAINQSAKRGAIKFFTSIENGGANCASCHSGDFFTDEKYHVLAIPQIGRGKGNDNGNLTNDDFGRFRESKMNADMYRFRTPSLLNVEVTGPWGHTGAYATLGAVVSHMLNPKTAIENYDYSQLDPSIQSYDMLTNTQFALNQLEDNRNNNMPNVHRDVTYNKKDISDLVAFLKTLTDPCVKNRDCLAPWIPNNEDLDPDGLRLNATGNSGEQL